MESRLPKPKTIGMKKAGSVTEVTSGFLNLGGTTDDAKSNVRTANGLKAIGKSKSTLNINAKGANENKPPLPKPGLMRSQTSAAIARNQSKGVKRLGATSNVVEPKRANIRVPVVSAPTTQRGARVGVANTTTGKPVVGATSKVAPKAKVQKWDLKGRLELATAELSTLKEKHKECSNLADMVEELTEKETTMTNKIDALENSNATLTDELTSAKRDYAEIIEKHENLQIELKESQNSYDKVSKALKKCEDTCASQKIILSEHEAKVQKLEKNLNKQKKTNEELNEKVKDLQSLVHQMDRDRRLLHNAIQELKGNIRVFCRVRPRIPKESAKALCTINFIDECTIEVGRSESADSASGKSRTKQEFTFDKVFPPTASQAEVFEELSLLVQSALEGYNVCVFAYGQTGSGKTYTMEGRRDSAGEGMIPRTVRHIFSEMKQFELLGWEYRIEASFLEIYNEHIVDLLDSQQKSHEIRMADSKGHDLYVSNLRVEEIHSPEELHDFLLTAQQNRAVAATFANERSSRSHSVARIRLIGTHAEKDELSIGNLNLVDLAGSERLKGEEAARTMETKNINKSLANLGNVILALLRKQDHIPYRNSKLTHLLMPSLGGNSKTLMLLNVSPLDECYNETLNSLRFASNVNSCKTGNIKRSRQMLHNSM